MEKALWRGGFVGWFASVLLRHRRWRIRYLPDKELLWRALYDPDHVYEDGTIRPTFFRDNRGGYSCDLARLSTEEQSRCGYAPSGWPKGAGLVAFRVGHVRESGSDVEHVPILRPPEDFENYSHCQFTAQLSRPDGELAMVERAWFQVQQQVRPVKNAEG